MNSPQINQRLKNLDEALFVVNQQINLLRSLKPLNLNTEKEKVFNDHHYNPQFEYRPTQEELKDIKKRLLSLIFKTTLIDQILEEKKDELIQTVELIEAIGTDKLTQASQRLYGVPNQHTITQALQELTETDFTIDKPILNTDQVKDLLQKRLNDYDLSRWKIKLKTTLADEATIGKNKTVLLREKINISKERIMTMLRHEIDCHVLRAENGSLQELQLFRYGFPNYLATEEGLAIYLVNQLGLKTKKIFFPQARVILVDLALKKSFSEVFQHAMSLGFNQEEAWNLTSRIKRGMKDTSKPGAFTKDWLYYVGYLQVANYLKTNRIQDLFIGKISLKYLSSIKNQQWLVPPKLLPKQPIKLI